MTIRLFLLSIRPIAVPTDRGATIQTCTSAAIDLQQVYSSAPLAP